MSLSAPLMVLSFQCCTARDADEKICLEANVSASIPQAKGKGNGQSRLSGDGRNNDSRPALLWDRQAARDWEVAGKSISEFKKALAKAESGSEDENRQEPPAQNGDLKKG